MDLNHVKASTYDDPIKPFANQDYHKLKRECNSSGKLFEDPLFPASYSSLFFGGVAKVLGVQWKRPKQIAPDARLFVEGSSTGDFNQGAMGNCWFVSASACIAMYPEKWSKVIPDAHMQEWRDDQLENYLGIFHFRFWRHGVWVDVVIDDKLPTVNGELIFCRSKARQEFWGALLEKAYAKLYGCYEALDSGTLEEAMVDFTGGIAETVNFERDGQFWMEAVREDLYSSLMTAFNKRSLLTAGTESLKPGESRYMRGIEKGHAYSITDIRPINIRNTPLFGEYGVNTLLMIRLRNPWGRGEWDGRFSDQSREWQLVSYQEKQRLGLVYIDDGEFWMLFEDFCRYFEDVSVCRVVNKLEGVNEQSWVEARLHSAWSNPSLAGGCANFSTYLQNPQFAFSVVKPQDEVMISLEQVASDRKQPKESIGFHVLQVEENRMARLNDPQPIVKTSTFINSRSVFVRVLLPEGRYVVIPCTYMPGKEMEFLLRVYTDEIMHPMNLVARSEQKRSRLCGSFPCGSGKESSKGSIRLTFVKAEGLQNSVQPGEAVYITVVCDSEVGVIPPASNSFYPQWNRSILFQRDDVNTPINIELRSKLQQASVDRVIGSAQLVVPYECENKGLQVPLKSKNPQTLRPVASLIVFVTARSNA